MKRNKLTPSHFGMNLERLALNIYFSFLLKLFKRQAFTSEKIPKSCIHPGLGIGTAYHDWFHLSVSTYSSINRCSCPEVRL